MANSKTIGVGPQVGKSYSVGKSHSFIKKDSFTESGGSKKSLKTTNLNIATLNVRSLNKDEKIYELEEEIKDLNWDIIGLAEVKRKGEERITLQSGNILYYKGHDEQSLNGVGFLVSKKYASRIEQYVGISERIAMIMMNIHEKITLKIIQVYAPTSTHPDEEIDEFYEKIIETNTCYHSTYTLIIGDFNAKIGQRLEETESYIGEFGYGVRNDRGETLVNFLHSNKYFAMNTFYKKKPQRKWTWLSPNGKTRNEIDYIMCNKKDIVEDVTVINSVSLGSDHRMVRAKLRIGYSKRRTNFKNTTQIDTEKLKADKEKYASKLKTAQALNLEQLSINKINSVITKELLNTSSEIATRHKK